MYVCMYVFMYVACICVCLHTQICTSNAFKYIQVAIHAEARYSLSTYTCIDAHSYTYVRNLINKRMTRSKLPALLASRQTYAYIPMYMQNHTFTFIVT